MVLSAAGLLDSRPAITHRGAVADLRGTSARVLEHRVVDDGDIVTCGGVTSSFDLSLWLVERFYSAEIANKVAAFLEYPRSTDIYVSHSERVPA
jgi:transcriptional regulator GlxA family with amidase domain